MYTNDLLEDGTSTLDLIISLGTRLCDNSFALALLKVTAMCLKLEIRLHAHPVGTTYNLVLKKFLHSSDWLMSSEPGFFACIVLFQAQMTA